MTNIIKSQAKILYKAGTCSLKQNLFTLYIKVLYTLVWPRISPRGQDLLADVRATSKHTGMRVDCYLHSMFPRAVHVSNRLLYEVVTAENLEDFRLVAGPTICLMAPPLTLKPIFNNSMPSNDHTHASHSSSHHFQGLQHYTQDLLVCYITKSLDIFFLDFQKAFDKCSTP